MAWSTAWKSALSSAQLEPIVLVDVGTLAWADPEIFPTVWGGTTFASQPYVSGITAGELNADHLVVDLRTNGQSVRIRDWTVNTGGFSFALTSSKPGRHALPFEPFRGLHVQVRMTFDGTFSELGVEVVARGMIDNVTHDGDTWWVQCRSMLDVMRTRYTDLAGGAQAQYFEDAGSRSIISSGPGWNSGAGNDLPVDGLSTFAKDNRTGAVGVAHVAGDTATNRKAWWFVYSAKSAASGAGTLTASGSADWFGNSTADNYPAGTIVTHYPVITGKPWNIFARLASSSGAGAATGFDTLPRKWGCSLPHSYIDVDDITAHTSHPALFDRDASPDVPIDPRWTPFVLAPVDNLLQWIQQGLGQLNMWPVVREDQLSVRLAYDYRYFDPLIVDWIDDDWIVSIDGHDLYHPDADVEYKRVGGTYNAAGALYSLAGRDPNSRPWLERFEKTISAHGLTVDGSEGQPNNQTCWVPGTSEALGASRVLTTAAHTWYTQLPEYLKLTTRTLRYAPLVPGDLVQIDSKHIIGRGGLYAGRVCMVTSVTPDWMRGSVVLEFAILPGSMTG
jgi:hypothetical protein